MVADDAEIRAWALDHGVEVSARGRVGNAAREAYSAAHNGTGAGPDYPAGMTDADFGALDQAAADLADDLDELPPRPVTPKAGSTLTPAKLSARFKRGKRPAARKARAKAQPRRSTAELIGSAWRIGAKLAQPVPPMYRTLRLQSVIAGPLLDTAVKDTFIDTVFLQKLAGLASIGETGAALLAPNLGIGAAAWHQAQCAKQGVDPNPIVMQGCAEIIRYGLIAMMRVGGDAFAAQLAREREDEERYGVNADMLMEWIMSPPADPATEEANIARMGAMFAGQPHPQPEPEPA